MNCKNLRIRSKNYKKYFYCVVNKCVVDATCCYCCKEKEYKATTQIKRTQIKKKTHKVSKMAKACDISQKTKEIVWERDGHMCIFCGNPVPVSCANSHYIPRSQGGLGIEQNIVTACSKCHHEQDNGLNTEYYDLKAQRYLQAHYGDLSKVNLIYTKYKTKEGE